MSDNKTYKELFSALEDKVRILGGQNLELEDAVRIFKEAKELYRECRKRIDNIEGDIKKILKSEDGSITEHPTIAEDKP